MLPFTAAYPTSWLLVLMLMPSIGDTTDGWDLSPVAKHAGCTDPGVPIKAVG